MFNLADATNYVVTLNVKDLLWGALILALIVLVIYIIALISKAIKNLSATHKIIKMNQENISKILENASNMSSNANNIVADISHTTNVFKPSVDNIADATESITKTFKDNNPVNEGIMKAYKVVSGANKMAKKYKDKKAEKDDVSANASSDDSQKQENSEELNEKSQ